MSDNSDEETNGEGQPNAVWVPYAERPEWRDVSPIQQDDGPNPIVAIAYSSKFRETHDYFRAIIKSGEKSERALNLTADCIWLNAANYTVWQYRREILKELGVDLNDELKFVEIMIKCNMKNYQVWHHRKIIVQWIQDKVPSSKPKTELKFTRTILMRDEKNYHAWQHRQWVISTFDLYDDELDYVDELLLEDIRNNSAWNQRYFVLKNNTQFQQEIIDREVDYALEKISELTDNESAWNYLRGILAHDNNGGLASNAKVMDKCKELYNRGDRINHLLACIIDICHERHSSHEPTDSLFQINKAFELCMDLAEKYDKIRRKYWEFISQQLTKTLQSHGK